MPAISSSHPGSTAFPPPAYMLLAIVVLIILGTVLARARRANSPSPSPEDASVEKAPLLPSHQPSSSQPPLHLPAPYSPTTGPPSKPSSPDIDVPRRRSYTKMTPAGMEINGEIIVAEGWRRHTKVFGGGVCAACEESERRLAKSASAGAGLA